MEDKKLFKKWWFWAIIAVIVIGAMSSLGQNKGNNVTSNVNSPESTNVNKAVAKLPVLNSNDYKDKEGLIAYKDLKSKGYTVNASFEKQALTDINGKASDLFESLDPNKTDDRLSVDAFVVGDFVQDGDNVNLTVVIKPTK